MRTKNAFNAWKTVKRSAIAGLLGALSIPALAAGCGSREVVVKEDQEAASPEANEMLDLQQQMFMEQAQQIHEQNQQQQQQ